MSQDQSRAIITHHAMLVAALVIGTGVLAAAQQDKPSSVPDQYRSLCSSVPATKASYEAFKNAAKARNGAAFDLRMWRLLPTDRAKAQALIDRYIAAYQHYYEYLFNSRAPIDLHFFESVLDDPKLPPLPRSDAGMVLYVETGSMGFLVKTIRINSSVVTLFGKIADPHFKEFVDAVLADDRFGASEANDRIQPLWKALRRAFPEFLEACQHNSVPHEEIYELCKRYGTWYAWDPRDPLDRDPRDPGRDRLVEAMSAALRIDAHCAKVLVEALLRAHQYEGVVSLIRKMPPARKLIHLALAEYQEELERDIANVKEMKLECQGISQSK